MSERNIHKTIRISKEVYDYIGTFTGSTWNDKVNNMVHHVLNSEADRENKITVLEGEIKKRQDKLNELDSVISNAKKVLGVNSYW